MLEEGPVAKSGDNIYRPLGPGSIEYTHFEQLVNPNHWDGDKPSQFDQKRDISGQFVLVADQFYYFGRNALVIPQAFRPSIPKGQSAHGKRTMEDQAKRFIDFISHKYKPGRHGFPHQWPEEKGGNIKTCGNK
jgi:hypothetical protein